MEHPCVRPCSRISAARVWLSGISKKNRFARNDAALGSETRPTPAGSESGTDEERLRKENKRSGEKGEAVSSLNSERRIKGRKEKTKKVSNQPHACTSSVSFASQHKGPERSKDTDAADVAQDGSLFTIGPSTPMKEF